MPFQSKRKISPTMLVVIVSLVVITSLSFLFYPRNKASMTIKEFERYSLLYASERPFLIFHGVKLKEEGKMVVRCGDSLCVNTYQDDELVVLSKRITLSQVKPCPNPLCIGYTEQINPYLN